MGFSNERRRIAHYAGILCAAKKIHPDHPLDWPVKSDFKYVILSYKKAATLMSHTWSYLKICRIPDSRIMVVVQNPECYRAYRDAGIPIESLVEINTSGYVDAFNRVFAPQVEDEEPLIAFNEVCVNMDDDICSLLTVGRQVYPSGRPQPMQVLNLDTVMMRQMELMEASACNLAGFDPCQNHGWLYKNTLFAQGRDHLGLRFIIGQVRIIRNQGVKLQLQTGKSDYELTFRYFEADGGIVRSPLQIKAKRFTGGCASQGQMEEAVLLKKHFPREIPEAPREHSDGTTSLRLAGMTFGEGRMLAKMKQRLLDVFGTSLSEKIFTEVEKEIKAEKHFERLQSAAFKTLANTKHLPLLRDSYISFMTERYGDDFDGVSAMAPFPTYSEDTYSKLFSTDGHNQQKGKGIKRKRATTIALKDCQSAKSALRTSVRIFEHAKQAQEEARNVEPPRAPMTKTKKTFCSPRQGRCPLCRKRADVSKLPETRNRLTCKQKKCGISTAVKKWLCINCSAYYQTDIEFDSCFCYAKALLNKGKIILMCPEKCKGWRRLGDVTQTKMLCQKCGHWNSIRKWQCYKCKESSYECTCKKPDS